MSEPERHPLLRSERAFLRPPERDDIPTFIEWLSDADLVESLGIRAPFSRVAEESWFDELRPRTWELD